MFDINQSISEWRKNMTAAGVTAPSTLDELESHLRQDTAALIASGEPEARAFQLAAERLGSARSVANEFHKTRAGRCVPVTIASWFWLVATVSAAAWFAGRSFTGKLDLLLAAHIVTIVAGYGAAFLAGSLGICYIFWARRRTLSHLRQDSVRRAVNSFCQISAVLVAAGFILGALWSKQHLLRYWEGDPREIGGLAVIVWLVALWAARLLALASDRVVMLMSIGGNVIVSLAWFGAGILAAGQRTGHYGVLACWLLAAFVVAHLCTLAIALAPNSSVAGPSIKE